jgi:hypothetical protein
MGAAPSWGESLPERFYQRRFDEELGQQRRSWREDKTTAGDAFKGTHWHTGDFFGDVALSLRCPHLPHLNPIRNFR